FLHGLFTGLINCVWITAVHGLFFQKYTENHTQLDKMTAGMPVSFATHPRVAMSLAGLGLGVLFAIVLGIFALVASKIVSKK
ncbi:MAG TPA: hypothetical protein VGC01_03195, partial [Mucilaginibacter sp.]